LNTADLERQLQDAELVSKRKNELESSVKHLVDELSDFNSVVSGYVQVDGGNGNGDHHEIRGRYEETQRILVEKIKYRDDLIRQLEKDKQLWMPPPEYWTLVQEQREQERVVGELHNVVEMKRRELDLLMSRMDQSKVMLFQMQTRHVQPEEERERLLERVKSDNQQISVIERRIAEVEETLRRHNQSEVRMSIENKQRELERVMMDIRSIQEVDGRLVDVLRQVEEVRSDCVRMDEAESKLDGEIRALDGIEKKEYDIDALKKQVKRDRDVLGEKLRNMKLARDGIKLVQVEKIQDEVYSHLKVLESKLKAIESQNYQIKENIRVQNSVGYLSKVEALMVVVDEYNAKLKNSL
jgi:hypothetical protein